MQPSIRRMSGWLPSCPLSCLQYVFNLVLVFNIFICVFLYFFAIPRMSRWLACPGCVMSAMSNPSTDVHVMFCHKITITVTFVFQKEEDRGTISNCMNVENGIIHFPQSLTFYDNSSHSCTVTSDRIDLVYFWETDLSCCKCMLTSIWTFRAPAGMTYRGQIKIKYMKYNITFV